MPLTRDYGEVILRGKDGNGRGTNNGAEGCFRRAHASLCAAIAVGGTDTMNPACVLIPELRCTLVRRARSVM